MIADNHTLQLIRQNKDPQVAHALKIRKLRPAQLATAHALQEHQRLPNQPNPDTLPTREAQEAQKIQNQIRKTSHALTNARLRSFAARLQIALPGLIQTQQPYPFPNPAPDPQSHARDPRYIIYKLNSKWNPATIQGASTAVPSVQTWLDVWKLIKTPSAYSPSPLLNTAPPLQSLGIPAPAPNTTPNTRIIYVVENSPQDIALASFPNFLQRIIPAQNVNANF